MTAWQAVRICTDAYGGGGDCTTDGGREHSDPPLPTPVGGLSLCRAGWSKATSRERTASAATRWGGSAATPSLPTPVGGLSALPSGMEQSNIPRKNRERSEAVGGSTATRPCRHQSALYRPPNIANRLFFCRVREHRSRFSKERAKARTCVRN